MSAVLSSIFATRMSTQDAIARWLLYIVRFTFRTQQHYKMVILRFEKYAPKYIDNLCVEHIDRYLDSILKHYTPRCANSYLTAVKSFCRFMAEHYDLPNPAAKIKMLAEQPPQPRILSAEEYHKVLQVAKGVERDAVQFIANTGLRLSEIRSLTPGCISSDRKTLSIVGKGRKRRIVPLNKTCQEILKPNSPINFLQSFSSRNSLYVLCCCLAKKAGIPKFGPHALRHYHATELARCGVPIYVISKLLGHSSIRTTEKIYVHFQDAFLIGSTDCLMQ